MKHTRSMLLAVAVVSFGTAALAVEFKSPDELQVEVESLRAKKVAWRQIEWKTCLLDGIKASREQRKPMILWIFIDRPIDDERC